MVFDQRIPTARFKRIPWSKKTHCSGVQPEQAIESLGFKFSWNYLNSDGIIFVRTENLNNVLCGFFKLWRNSLSVIETYYYGECGKCTRGLWWHRAAGLGHGYEVFKWGKTVYAHYKGEKARSGALEQKLLFSKEKMRALGKM